MKKYSKNDIINILNNLNIKFIDFDYINIGQKISYYCPKCNTLKEGKICHIINKHYLCVKCAGKEKRTQEEADRMLKERNIVYKPFIYKNGKTKIKTECPDCKEWKISAFNDLKRGFIYCVKCGNKRTIISQTLSQNDAENKLTNLGIIFKPFKYQHSKQTMVEIKCKSCDSFFKTKFGYLGNNGSILCNRCKTATSTGENEVKDYIKSLGIKIEENIKIKGVELDIYIPKLKIGIEYNGNYWHSDFQKHKNYHFNKITHFNENNIRLIMINEYEWINDDIKTKKRN